MQSKLTPYTLTDAATVAIDWNVSTMPAIDDFPSKTTGVSGPYVRAEAITPHDTNELSRVTRAIYVGGAGAVKVTTVKGDAVTFAAVPVGTVLPVRAKVVWSTGTAATNLLGLS